MSPMRLTWRSISMSPRFSSRYSSSKLWSKWSSIARFWLLVTMMTWSMPAATASSTAYWMIGLSTSGSISLGCALVAGRKRVPQPAAGNTALRTRIEPSVGGSPGWRPVSMGARVGPEYTAGPTRAATPRLGPRPCRGVDRSLGEGLADDGHGGGRAHLDERGPEEHQQPTEDLQRLRPLGE